MKQLFFLFLSILISQSVFTQKKSVEKKECKGIYWLSKENDQINHDSVRILGSIRAIQKDELYRTSYCFIQINNTKYWANKEGNFDFKIKPGTYSLYARNPETHNLTTKPINFRIGIAYVFDFYLLAQIIRDTF